MLHRSDVRANVVKDSFGQDVCARGIYLSGKKEKIQYDTIVGEWTKIEVNPKGVDLFIIMY